MDTAARRSRMRRTRIGKRIELTSRDIEIFRLLARYRYLSSAYIHVFVGGASETRFKERLGDLFHEGYIDRPERQWELADCRHRPVIHEMGEGGRRVLDAHGIGVEPITWLRSGSHRQFAHSLMICELLASIELGIRDRQDLRFVAWPEILAKAPSATRESTMPFRLLTATPSGGVVPDGLFGIEYPASDRKAYRFFALEADRGTMPVSRSNGQQSSFLDKVDAYHNLLLHRTYRAALGIPNLLVLTTTLSDSRALGIMQRIGAEVGSNAFFLFKSATSANLRSPAPELLSEPWGRAGLPELRIDA